MIMNYELIHNSTIWSSIYRSWNLCNNHLWENIYIDICFLQKQLISMRLNHHFSESEILKRIKIWNRSRRVCSLMVALVINMIDEPWNWLIAHRLTGAQKRSIWIKKEPFITIDRLVLADNRATKNRL